MSFMVLQTNKEQSEFLDYTQQHTTGSMHAKITQTQYYTLLYASRYWYLMSTLPKTICISHVTFNDVRRR